MLNRMGGTIKDISIVVPVFNAAPALIALQAEIDKVMALEGITYKLILVDDGSEDKSWEVIRAIKNNHPEKVTAIRMSKNYGQHNAIFVGFLVSVLNRIFMMKKLKNYILKLKI